MRGSVDNQLGGRRLDGFHGKQTSPLVGGVVSCNRVPLCMANWFVLSLLIEHCGSSRCADIVGLALPDDHDSFHLRVKRADVGKSAGFSECVPPGLPCCQRARVKRRGGSGMRNEIIVFPLNHAALVYFDSRRIELNIAYRNRGAAGGKVTVYFRCTGK